MPAPDRRSFVKFASAAAIATQAHPILGANDRVNVAVVGIGGRGSFHLRTYLGLPTARITGLCDVNQAAREVAQAAVAKAGQDKAAEYEDMRKLFDDKNVDAVSIATPNHWHALSAIWAVQAGKDVYVEKPASHNIFEGHQMIAAARKHKRMMQVGSQSRSTPLKMEAMKLLHDGAIGKIYLAKALCFKRRKSIGVTPAEPVPAGVNWDIFLGPAPVRPFTKNRFKYNWHWFWDTGNGDIGNQGVHEMDIARWGLGLPDARHEGLKTIYCTGGKFAYVDDQETPNTQLATFDYGDKQIVFEVRGILTNGESGMTGKGNVVGNLFLGSDGILEVDDSGYRVYKGEDRVATIQKKRERNSGGDENTTGLHMTNFLNAVKSRNHKDLTAEIEIGASSAALCHMANIAYRTGRQLKWDVAKEQFIGDSDANKMLTRDYRKPYVVEKV
jgi:predicted dehydrogenase